MAQAEAARIAIARALAGWTKGTELRKTFLAYDRVMIAGDQRVTEPKKFGGPSARRRKQKSRSEEHTSELQSQSNLVCRLLLEKKNIGPVAQLIEVAPHRQRLGTVHRTRFAIDPVAATRNQEHRKCLRLFRFSDSSYRTHCFSA